MAVRQGRNAKEKPSFLFGGAAFMRPTPKPSFFRRLRWLGLLAALFSFFCIEFVASTDCAATDLQIPRPGDHSLQILSPTLLELSLVNTKQPDPGRVDTWDWVNDQQSFVPPDS